MEEKTRTRKSGINQLAFGSIVFVWGTLLVLKQVGIITVSTLPLVFTAFGALLVVSGGVKLSISRHTEQSIETR
jgi:hypothetical protein